MACRSVTVRAGDLEVHLVHRGRAQTLVVLRPEFASGRWFTYHNDLPRHRHVYAPDHPGFGQTPRPDCLEQVENLATFYTGSIGTLRWPSVDAIFEKSLGGWIAADLARLFPERICRLLFARAAGLRTGGEQRFDSFARPFEETLQHLFFAPDRWLQLLPTEPGPDVILRAYREATTLARISWNPYLYDPKLDRRLGRVRCPVLIVWGAKDRFLSPAHARAYAHALPHAQLELVPNCGHLPPLECREAFIALVVPFLRG